MHKQSKTRPMSLVIAAIACAAAICVHTAWAAGTRPLPVPPKIIAGKFKPDPVTVGNVTTAHLVGQATPPEKVDPESMAVLTWAWHIDKVQTKTTEDTSFNVAPPSTYEAAIAGSGSQDANATLTLKPRRAGFWKVTVHATATYTNDSGTTFSGNSDPVDLLVKSVEQTVAQ